MSPRPSVRPTPADPAVNDLAGSDGPGRGYRAVLRADGALAPVVATALTAVPIGVLGLALLLLVQTATGSPAAAGTAAAALGLGVAVGMLVQGRLIDAHGPRRVLPVVGLVQVLALVGLVLAARDGSAVPLIAATAFTAGAAEPQVVGSARAVWSRTVAPGLRSTGVALTSLVFDACVALGPLLLAALLLVRGPQVAVLACAAAFGAGTLVFARSRAGRAWRPAPPSAPRVAVPWGVLAPLAGSTAVQGLLLGALQIAGVLTVAASDHPAAAFALAALPLGSLVGTAVAGLRPPARATRRVRVLLLLVAPALAIGLLGGPASAVAALFAAGTLLGPVAVGCHGAISRVVPPAAQVRAFTVVTGCGIVAMSTGTAAAGLVASAGFPVFAVTAAAAVAGALLVAVLARRSAV